MEIPGFYYDVSKKKYFKISSGSNDSHKYNSTAIKKVQNENERNLKRIKIDNRQTIGKSKDHFRLKPFSNVDLQLNYSCHNQRRFDLCQYKLKKFRFQSHHNTRGRLNSDKFQKITYDDVDNMIILSSQNNLYQVSNQDISLNHELFPMLKMHRTDKINSTLRDLSINTRRNSKIIFRTWVGFGEEPSEAEVITETATSSVMIRHTARTSMNESFNTSIFNPISDSMVICGSKKVHKLIPEILESYHDVIFEGSDILSADFKDGNTYLLGTRKGQALIIDDRMDNKRNKQTGINQAYTNSSSLGSLINIKYVSGNRAWCSYIGTKVKLFDLRMGFKHSLIDYNSTKKVENVFGENVNFLDDGNFMLQNGSNCELFNIMSPLPISTIDINMKSSKHVVDSCGHFSKSELKDSIFFTDGEEISVYE